MPRIRSIKPEFWTSEQVTDCSRDARLTFIGMWNFCDDSGIHPASVKRLKMEVFPSDDCSLHEVAGWVKELTSVGLIDEYDVNGRVYWIITGFRAHQKIDTKTYRHPLPDGSIPTNQPRRGAKKNA